MLDINQKFNLALKARENSYSPYSHFKVGALAILKDGNYVLGTNVENMSYGLTICAERSAIFSLISLGYNPKDICAFVIIADSEKPVSPCGACRQVLAEFLSPDCDITLFNIKKDYVVFKLKDLLPYAFDKGDLDE